MTDLNTSLASSGYLLLLFGASSSPASAPTMSALAGYQPYVADENQKIQTYSQQTQVQQDVTYFQNNISKVKSVADLTNDPKLLAFITKAFGLDADSAYPAKIAAVLNSNLSDTTSYANSLLDPRYQQLAKESNSPTTACRSSPTAPGPATPANPNSPTPTQNRSTVPTRRCAMRHFSCVTSATSKAPTTSSEIRFCAACSRPRPACRLKLPTCRSRTRRAWSAPRSTSRSSRHPTRRPPARARRLRRHSPWPKAICRSSRQPPPKSPRHKLPCNRW